MILISLLLLLALICLAGLLYRYLKLKRALPLLVAQLKKETVPVKTTEADLQDLAAALNQTLTEQAAALAKQKEYAALEQQQQTAKLQKVQQQAQATQLALTTASENLLNAAQAQLTAAQTELAQVEQDHFAAQIKYQLDQATQQLADLKLYQQLITQQITIHSQMIDLTQLLKRLLQPYYEDLQTQNFRLALQLTSNLKLQSDPIFVERIIQESLDNVLAHGQNEVRINLTKDAHFIYLTIQNQSLPVTTKPLTAPFYTAQPTTDPAAGLGLYFVQELVHLTGGILTLSYDQPVFTLQISWRL